MCSYVWFFAPKSLVRRDPVTESTRGGPVLQIGGVRDGFWPKKFRHIVGGEHGTSMLNKSAVEAFGNAVLLGGIRCREFKTDAAGVEIVSELLGDIFFGVVAVKSFDMFSSLGEDVRVVVFDAG
jgi:hypothetical protein